MKNWECRMNLDYNAGEKSILVFFFFFFFWSSTAALNYLPLTFSSPL